MSQARSTATPLTEGPVARALLAFAMPAMAATLLQTLNGSINAMWIGHLVGKEGLAAASNINLVLGLGHSLTFGFGMAVSILIARAMGAGNLAAMRRSFGAGLALFAAAGVTFAIVGWIEVPRLLRWLDVPPDAMPLALDYARVSFAGLPASLLFAYLQLALRGSGDARTPLLFIIPSALLDVILNPLLILGAGPLPELGIAGSALASVLATSAGLALLAARTWMRDLPLRLRGPELAYLVPSPQLVLVIVKQGLPMGVQMIATSVGAVAVMGLVNGEGTATVAAYAAVAQLWGYAQMPALGLGGAAGTMAAQNIGAGRWDRVDRIAAVSAGLGFAITAAGVVLILLLDRHAFELFFQPTPAELAVARDISWRATWGLVIFGAAVPLVVIPRANGAAIAPLLIMGVSFLPGRLGFAYALLPHWGADAIWWSFPASYAIAGALIGLYYRYGGWRRLDVLTRVELPREVTTA